MPATLSVAGKAVTRGHVTVPRQGAWHADLWLDADTAPSGAVSGTAIVRCVDANGEMFDAVITYRPKSLGTLSMTPGLWYMNSQWQTGTVTGLRVNLTLKPTITFRAYGGTGNYSWTRTGGNGTLSSTTGAAVTYTTGTS